RVIFLEVSVKYFDEIQYTCPVIYVFSENEAFFSDVVLPNEAKFSHVALICYGGGCGGGGKSTGNWLKNVLYSVNCETLIQSVLYKDARWRSGDEFMTKILCPQFALRRIYKGQRYRKIGWGCYGLAHFENVKYPDKIEYADEIDHSNCFDMSKFRLK
ncbi:MAG: hypothetical protein ACRC37_06200, partial [Lentisphaeria bacterium]